MKVRYLIVGAGISGCAAARLLQLRGDEDFFILEAEGEPGGLCRTRRIGPHVLDIGGGHFFCTRYPEVREFVFAHLPEQEFRLWDRVSKIEIEGETIDYPIEFNLWQLSPGKGRRYLESALRTGEVEGQAPPASFAEWIRWRLGTEIAENYMLPYNRKLWGVEPEEMDVDWLAKTPRVDTGAIRESFLLRDSLRSRMPSHERFYYPREGGFQRIFDAISAPVANRISLRDPLRTLERRDGVWRVNGAIDAEVVISTVPWSTVHAAEEGDPRLREHLARLRCTSLVVSLHEESYDHHWHWLYRPDESLRHHREFFIHNFAPHSATGGVYRETHGRRWRGDEGEVFSYLNPIAYPIPVRGHAAAVGEVAGHYAAQRLYGLGRWGQHQYFNSDVCIREAMRLVAGLP
ncbi:MAG: protoporphyrinogen/coproporphyrinogen oxidase [Acidobacteriota bacterium]